MRVRARVYVRARVDMTHFTDYSFFLPWLGTILYLLFCLYIFEKEKEILNQLCPMCVIKKKSLPILKPKIIEIKRERVNFYAIFLQQ